MKPYTLALILFLLPTVTNAVSEEPVELIRATTERIPGKLAQAPEIKSEPDRLKRLVEQADLPTIVPDLNVAGVMQAMQHDKKVLQGKVRFVLLKCLGEAFVTDEVNLSLVEKVLVNDE